MPYLRVRYQLGAVWISNESPGVLPAVAAKLSTPPPADRNLLSVNGEPVALTGPHGQSVDWLPGLQPGRFVRPPPEDVFP